MIVALASNSNRLSIADAARALGLRPRDLSDAFYGGVLPENLGPLDAGRRTIAPNDLPKIAALLRAAGKRVATCY